MDTVKKNKGGLLVLLALVILTVVFFATKKPKEVIVNDDMIEDSNPLVGSESSANVYIPMPSDSSWMQNEVSENKLTLDVPEEYYISKPRIGDCDVTSISTVSNGKPVSVALVYNVGCDNADLQNNLAQSIEKNCYVFRTNYTSPSVVAIFERIVNSAR